MQTERQAVGVHLSITKNTQADLPQLILHSAKDVTTPLDCCKTSRLRRKCTFSTRTHSKNFTKTAKKKHLGLEDGLHEENHPLGVHILTMYMSKKVLELEKARTGGGLELLEVSLNQCYIYRTICTTPYFTAL